MEIVFAVFVVGAATALVLHHLQQRKQLPVVRDYDIKAFEAIPSGVFLVDKEGVIQYANRHAGDMTGYSTYRLVGMKVEKLMPERFRSNHVHLRNQYQEKPTDRPMGQGRDLYILTKDCEELPVEIALGTTSSGEDPLTLVVISDISDRRKMEKKVQYLAYHDSLTELSNRDSFMEKARESITRARKSHSDMVVMLVDINNFKRVNDTLGHHVGDAVLQQLAAFLQEQVSTKCDDQEHCSCFVARFGGDEFAVVMEHHGIEIAKALAMRIHDRFKKPITVQDRETLISISMGAATFPHSGITLQQLLKGADLALHHAKREGKKQLYVYDKIMTTQIEQFVRYEEIIRHFIDNNDFILHYQPIVNIGSGMISGAEALFRSNPDKFENVDLGLLIDVAEETGLIVDLGKLIFRRACEDCKVCNEKFESKNIISINVSVRQLEQPFFVEEFSRIINEVDVDPKNVAIEVTETMVMANGKDVIGKLLRIRNLGVHVYIDDFGKGYSSMTYLRRLPADKLKIDQSFIENVVHDEMDAEIFSAINNVAQTLGLTTCAEGVETVEQMDIAKKFNVDQAQGYLVGKPMPYSELSKVIERNQHGPQTTKAAVCRRRIGPASDS